MTHPNAALIDSILAVIAPGIEDAAPEQRADYEPLAQDVIEAVEPLFWSKALRGAAGRIADEIDGMSPAIPALEDWADEFEEIARKASTS